MMCSGHRIAGAVCGLLAVVVFLSLYSVAMSLDSEYVFGKNYLSDLGVREGAWAFNSGLIVAGLLFALFDTLGLRRALGFVAQASLTFGVLVIGATFLMLVGIFTEDAGDIHGIVSYGFFLTMFVALPLVGLCLYKSRYLGRLGYIVPFALFLLGLPLLSMEGDPFSETLAVLMIVLWGLITSLALLLKETGHKIP